MTFKNKGVAMIKEKRKEVEKDVKAYVGDKTIKGASKVAKPVAKGAGILAGGIVSAILAIKGIKKLKTKSDK